MLLQRSSLQGMLLTAANVLGEMKSQKVFESIKRECEVSVLCRGVQVYTYMYVRTYVYTNLCTYVHAHIEAPHCIVMSVPVAAW